MKNCNKQYGVTLIEFMIAGLVMSIIVAVGLPSLQKFVVNSTIYDAASEINAGLQETRSRAITQNTQMQFVLAGTTWSIRQGGTTIETRATRNTEGTISVSPTSLTVTFNGQGRLTVGSASQTIQITSPGNTCMAGGGDVRCLNVLIETGGKSKVCDPSLSATDARSCH